VRSPLRLASTLAIAAAAACGGSGSGPLDHVDAIVFIERPSRMDGMGDIFQYQSYVAGAKLMKLSPPSADGTLTVLCCDGMPEYEGADIIAYDISFDARTIVMSARLSADQRYGLFVLDVATGQVEQLPTDPDADFVYPTFLPGDRILFATSAVVEEGAPQFRDEYERGVTLQMGSIGKDGAGLQLYSRNLSHRITSTVMHTGEVLFTQWDHLNMMNSGHLLRMNPDGTRVREAFGKENTGVTNSYYKAIEVAPGRVIAIGSSRDMTFQSGTILDIRLGEAYQTTEGELWADKDMSEVTASYRILTAQVPLGDEPSFPSVGRYYNAYPLNAKEYPDLLVSWADGPVQSDVNGAAGVAPDFGLYLFDSSRGTRRPIYDKAGTWEISPMPLAPRPAPPTIPATGGNGFSSEAVLMGSMNVHESSLGNLERGSIYGVRVIEGFSGEEGVGGDFGLTEAEGAATLGIAPVRDDGSWAALVPANIPIHQIAIDRYGLGVRNEPIWISGRPGEALFCGGCHESRTGTTVIQPGITDAIAIGPDDLLSAVARFDRVTTSAASPVGIPWDTALQPIFDAKCVSCHDGTPGAANKSFTITDPATGESQTFTFDLRGGAADITLGEVMLSGYSRSHLSLLGPAMLTSDPDLDLQITGDMPIYVIPENARQSILIQILNPPRQFPTVDMGDRAFGGVTGHSEVQGAPLTAEEHRLLVEMVDNGGQFYSRENSPGLTYGQ
jgi:hypothetical protein